MTLELKLSKVKTLFFRRATSTQEASITCLPLGGLGFWIFGCLPRCWSFSFWARVRSVAFGTMHSSSSMDMIPSGYKRNKTWYQTACSNFFKIFRVFFYYYLPSLMDQFSPLEISEKKPKSSYFSCNKIFWPLTWKLDIDHYVDFKLKSKFNTKLCVGIIIRASWQC